MVNLLATGAAALAVLMFVTALVSIAVGEIRIAGLSFLSASLLIYLRETRFLDK